MRVQREGGALLGRKGASIGLLGPSVPSKILDGKGRLKGRTGIPPRTKETKRYERNRTATSQGVSSRMPGTVHPLRRGNTRARATRPSIPLVAAAAWDEGGWKNEPAPTHPAKEGSSIAEKA